MERLLIGADMQEGDILFMRVRNKLLEKTSLSEEEITKFEMVTLEDGRTKWNPDMPQEAEVEITDIEHGIIKDFMVKRNQEHKLTPDHVSLYEKFVENGSKP